MSFRPGSKADSRKKGFKKAIDADEARRKREGACECVSRAFRARSGMDLARGRGRGRRRVARMGACVRGAKLTYFDVFVRFIRR